MRLMEHRRALMMAQNKNVIVLPKEYTKLNYIEGTGTQWIDTKYLCADDYTPYRVKCRFKMTDISSGSFIFGTNSHSTGVRNVLSLSVDVNQKKFVVSRLGNTGSGLRFGTLDTEMHEFEYVFKDGSYFDGVFVDGSEQQASITNIASGKNMGLFARLSEGSAIASSVGKCQIYSFELYGQDEIQRNFVPAQRKSDGVIGMYDVVTNVFVTNSGTGEFIGG